MMTAQILTVLRRRASRRLFLVQFTQILAEKDGNHASPRFRHE